MDRNTYGRTAGGDVVLRAERLPGLMPLRMRVVGPGRRERDYRERIESLESELDREQGEVEELRRELAAQGRELEMSTRIERGCQRHIDRIDMRLWQVEQQKDRVILALGAMQRENQLLRRKVARLTARPASEPAALPSAAPTRPRGRVLARPREPRLGILARLFHRRERRSAASA